ncbi:hypothetical protein FGX00_03280, partial [Xylella fastidiosa subsp. multiplex]|nr:hypothetical protein [Xylella fastidiosa subsp. multiplex]
MLAGLSVNGGLAYMNSVSTTTQGGRWTSKVLWNVLTAPRIAGMMERDGVLYEASWDAVITNEEREALIALRAQKRKEKPNP